MRLHDLPRNRFQGITFVSTVRVQYSTRIYSSAPYNCCTVRLANPAMEKYPSCRRNYFPSLRGHLDPQSVPRCRIITSLSRLQSAECFSVASKSRDRWLWVHMRERTVDIKSGLGRCGQAPNDVEECDVRIRSLALTATDGVR